MNCGSTHGKVARPGLSEASLQVSFGIGLGIALKATFFGSKRIPGTGIALQGSLSLHTVIAEVYKVAFTSTLRMFWILLMWIVVICWSHLTLNTQEPNHSCERELSCILSVVATFRY